MGIQSKIRKGQEPQGSGVHPAMVQGHVGKAPPSAPNFMPKCQAEVFSKQGSAAKMK